MKTLGNEERNWRGYWKHLPPMFVNWWDIVKTTTLPKATYRLKAISTNILMQFITEIEQIVLNLTRTYKRSKLAMTIVDAATMQIASHATVLS